MLVRPSQSGLLLFTCKFRPVITALAAGGLQIHCHGRGVGGFTQHVHIPGHRTLDVLVEQIHRVSRCLGVSGGSLAIPNIVESIRELLPGHGLVIAPILVATSHLAEGIITIRPSRTIHISHCGALMALL